MKNFDDWNKLKKALSENETKILFKEGEIWWASIGQNLGEETFGKGSKFRRFIIVFRKLTGNSCIVIFLTSKERVGSWYFKFEVDNVVWCVMMYQLRVLSTKRFESRMATILEKDFKELKNAVGKFYNIL